MKITASCKAKQEESWTRKVQPGRSIVTVYRRKTPSCTVGFLVSNYADAERRRVDSYKTEQVALEAGNSPNVVFKLYRELVKPTAAQAWFAVSPEAPANVVTLAAKVQPTP